MDRFPEGAILVTFDEVGLYPHIPHNEGLEAIRKILNTRTNQEIPTDDIVNLAELVLKNSNFEFDGKHSYSTNKQLSSIQFHEQNYSTLNTKRLFQCPN